MGRPLRVLHLPTGCGGNAWRLAQGERALGLDSRVLYSHAPWMGYPADISLGLERVRSLPGRLLRLGRAFLQVRGSYDVFHFNFGSSLFHLPGRLPLAELPFYPRRARLFATYNGCDARQKFPTLERGGVSACAEPDCYGGVCTPATDEAKRRSITKMATHARHLFGLNPDLVRFLPPGNSSFLPYALPVDEFTPAVPDFGRRRLKIVHAPTDRGCKGSGYVLAALEEVRRRRPGEVEIVLVENLSFAEALARYRDADIVVDQVLVGWYGALAAEAMALGKAVVCRIEPRDLGVLPPAMASDLASAMAWAGPGDLAQKLEELLDNRSSLADTARAGLDYVRTWHDAKRVAEQVRAHYEA